jgi:glycine/D-amino acid oxidase-like deaminating enzyme
LPRAPGFRSCSDKFRASRSRFRGRRSSISPRHPATLASTRVTCRHGVEHEGAFYGLPSIEGRGFKVAPDWPGPEVDPDTQERRLSDDLVAASRGYLRRRFPDLAERPVAEGRVCQYELTNDTHFVIDRHPTVDDAWIVGGGSGHGFKHGPVVGEYVSGLIVGADVSDLAPRDGRFALGTRIATGVALRTSATAPGEAC